jgi:hypothetical protein
MAALASSFGLNYVDTPNRSYRDEVPGGLPWGDLPLLQQSEVDDLHHLMYGEFAGQRTQAFNLDLVTYREESSFPKRSCVLFSVDASFPVLTVSPHSRLSRAQERDRSPFSQKYRILGRDPQVSELLLDEPMREWLLGLELPLRFEVGYTSVLGHVAQDPDVWGELFQALFGFFIRIPDQAWSYYGKP